MRDGSAQMLWYERLAVGFLMSTDVKITVKKQDILQIEKKLLENGESSEELDVSRCEASVDVNCLRYNECERQEEETLKE